MPGLELKVSLACYNEIANAMEASGKKLATGAVITIEKDDKIINPLDWRLVTVRRDACNIAMTAYRQEEADENGDYHSSSKGFVPFCEEIYQFILRGTVETPKDKVPMQETAGKPKAGWK